MAQPAKSARLQLLEGNPNRKTKKELEKRIENEEKMKMKSDSVNPPNWLNETGKKEFKRVSELLLEIELINNADVTHLALYCDAYAQYVSYKQQVRKHGMWVDDKPNPFIIRMRDAAAQVRSFSADLGLSPSARAKLAISLEDDSDDEDDF